MKIVFQIICLTLSIFSLAARAGEEFKISVHQHVSGYGITNTWFIAKSRLEKLPKWDEQGEPPLSVGKAASLAKDWVVSKGGQTNCYVVSIQFRSIDRGNPPVPPSKESLLSPVRAYWFYVVNYYQVYQYGSSVTCVVLPDGSIIEPESTPSVTNHLHYLD
jgi:hypothetical protein